MSRARARLFGISLTLVAGSFVHIAGQPAQTPAVQPAPSDSSVTIVGCLMRTDRSAHRPGTSYSSTNGAGSGPATANSGAGSGFVLKDATVVEHAAPAAASGGGEAPRHVGLQEFRVIVEDSKLHLASHVNSQVEVQGHLATSATTSEQHGQAATGGGPRLNIGANAVVVTAIRTAAPGCPVG